MVVAGASGNDSERRSGLRQGLPRDADDTVATGGDESVGALGDGLACQIERLLRGAALDLGDGDAPLAQSGDGSGGRPRGVALPAAGLVRTVTDRVMGSACQG